MRAIFILLLVTVLPASAQRRVGAAYYDTGGLYDTIPSLFYDDGDYTPSGRLRWDTERYCAALDRLVSVVDSLAMPLVGLCGVENEQVALDAARRSRGDYCVIHRTLNTLDGQDLALLYQGDRFLPARVETGYGWLGVVGELDGSEVAVLLFRRARFLKETVEEWRERFPGARLLVMGAADAWRGERFGLRDALAPAERRGRGNVRMRGGWRMADRIWADTAWRVVRADVYARRRLFDEVSGEPLPLYEGAHAPRKLPVFVYLKPENMEK